MKFKLIICGIIPIFWVQLVFPGDDAYLQELKKTIDEVNASVDATVKSVEDAIEKDNVETELNARLALLEPEITRAMITTGIRDNQPVNDLTVLDEPRKRLFFYTELVGMANRRLQHRWYYKNQEVGIEDIVPRSQHWRAISGIQLDDRQGQWAVELVDEENTVLVHKELVYWVR